ncbi:Serine/threonine-protein phosphatase 7 long form [Glycine soja]
MAHKPLLCHQHVHRSRTTINNLITSYYHTIPEPEPQILPLLSCTGFQHITLIKQCRIDPALGECTITLEDVALHLRIRVDGRVMLLREVPPENAHKGATPKLTWLLSILRTPLPKEPTTHKLQCRCRAYIMYMINNVLIPDKSGNRVHLIYLNLLRDLNNIKKYSWGSACLANLYKELWRASSKVGKVMGGCVILLQSWAWYRIPFIALRVIRPETTYPLAKRLEYSVTPHDDLVRYRSRIYHMESHEFSWVLYRGFEEHLSRQAYRDIDIWYACTAIICFLIVEWHQTNWVKLQFGLQQDIPIDPMNLDRFHQIDMRGNHYSDGMEYHAEWINI